MPNSNVACVLLQAHKAYLEGTEHRTASFRSLTKSDAAAAHLIEQRMKKLIKLQVRALQRCSCCCCWVLP